MQRVSVFVQSTCTGGFEVAGQGQCRESTCDKCSDSFTIKSICVKSLAECQAECKALSGTCKGVAYAGAPSVDYDGCKKAGKGRYVCPVLM